MAVIGRFHPGKLGVSHDGGEDIVEIMGDAPRQCPDGLHLLRLAEPGLQLEVPADVPDDPLVSGYLSRIVAPHAHGEKTVALYPVFSHKRDFEVLDEALFFRLPAEDATEEGIGVQFLECHPGEVFPGVSEQVEEGLVYIDEPAFPRGDGDGVPRFLKKTAVSFLTGAQGTLGGGAFSFHLHVVEGEGDIFRHILHEPLFFGLGDEPTGRGDRYHPVDLLAVRQTGDQRPAVFMAVGQGAVVAFSGGVVDDQDPCFSEGLPGTGGKAAGGQLFRHGKEVFPKAGLGRAHGPPGAVEQGDPGVIIPPGPDEAVGHFLNQPGRVFFRDEQLVDIPDGEQDRVEVGDAVLGGFPGGDVVEMFDPAAGIGAGQDRLAPQGQPSLPSMGAGDHPAFKVLEIGMAPEGRQHPFRNAPGIFEHIREVFPYKRPHVFPEDIFLLEPQVSPGRLVHPDHPEVCGQDHHPHPQPFQDIAGQRAVMTGRAVGKDGRLFLFGIRLFFHH